MENETPKILLDHMPDGIYFVDENRVITYWNKAAENITGYSTAELIGKSCANNILRHMDITGHELCENGCPLQATIQDGQKREAHVFLHHKDGHRVPVHVRVNPVRNAEGEIVGAVETFSENTEELEMLKMIEELEIDVYQDPLLKIGNRRLMEKVFETQEYQKDQLNGRLGIIYFDIDFFKHINDNFGHLVGDDVLRMVSRSVTGILRKSDLLIRWGGDEFIIFLHAANPTELKTVAERVKVFVERSFIMVTAEKVSVTVSIGATFAKAQETLNEVIERSDALMYQCKRNGRNCIMIG